MPDIMVIDDDRHFCILMKKMLELDGYVVTTNYDIDAAREHLEQQLPDLVCCDLKMSRGDGGFEFLAQRGKIQGLIDVPVVAITGDSMPSSRVEAAKLGVFAYLVKPFTKGDLISTIESALISVRH